MSVKMRHDSHYVEDIVATSRSIGKTIPIDSIEPNPEQPRNEFGDLTELTASIKEKGVLEPLLVKRDLDNSKYMIIAGERRWRASKLAGLKEVPCIEMEIDEKGVAEIALIENLQRKDLTVWEEADGLKALADKFGYKHDQIAQKISKSRTTVTEFMSIAGLPADIRQRCRAANINSKAVLLDIARQFDEAAMFDYMDGLEGKKPLPKATKSNGKAEKKPDAKTDVADPAAGFNFVAFDDTYEIHVQFKEAGKLNRTNTLKALKEAFDALKAGEVDV
jgi:ParB family chromosome partitioning protein